MAGSTYLICWFLLGFAERTTQVWGGRPPQSSLSARLGSVATFCEARGQLRLVASELQAAVPAELPQLAHAQRLQQVNPTSWGFDLKKIYTSRDPKQLRTDGQAQTCQQLVAFCASTRMNQNDAVVNPARFALLHVCCWRASRFSTAQELRLGKRAVAGERARVNASVAAQARIQTHVCVCARGRHICIRLKQHTRHAQTCTREHTYAFTRGARIHVLSWKTNVCFL